MINMKTSITLPLFSYEQDCSKVREQERRTAEGLVMQMSGIYSSSLLRNIYGLYKMKHKLKMHTKKLQILVKILVN